MYKFLLLLLLVSAGVGTSSAQNQSAYHQQIRQAADQFIASLSPLQQRGALLSYEDSARQTWNNLPVGLRPRAGISIGSMNDDQRKILHRILSACLSSQGYLKATSIMHLDNLLNSLYDSLYYRQSIDSNVYKMVKDLKWSHRNFYLAFFGKPGDTRWSLKVEGHHLSINFTFLNDQLSVTPFFIGTDPAEYPISEYAGWRVLGQEEDLGLSLMKSLNAATQKKVIISDKVPGDIITSAESGIRLIDYQGVQASQLSTEQKSLLLYIIREFVFNMEYDKAMIEYNKILKAGIDKIYFAWIGPVQEFKPHYYVINGPNFLIEFDNHGFNNDGNHIHAIWREKGNEYGEDVLKKHYQSEKH